MTTTMLPQLQPASLTAITGTAPAVCPSQLLLPPLPPLALPMETTGTALAVSLSRLRPLPLPLPQGLAALQLLLALLLRHHRTLVELPRLELEPLLLSVLLELSFCRFQWLKAACVSENFYD